MNDEQQKQQQRTQSVQQKMKMEMGLNDGMQQPMINLHSKRKQVISCMKMYFIVAFQWHITTSHKAKHSMCDT